MRNGYSLTVILTLALTGLYGCDDEVTDLDAFVESAEAQAILESARALPLLPNLIEVAAPGTSRDEAVLVRARELWAAGSDVGRRADEQRRLAVGYALPVLVTSVPAAQWAEVRAGAEAWIATGEGMLRHLSLPRLEERVAAARGYLQQSDAARGDDRREKYYLLLATSELMATTPRYLARAMVRDADGALARASTQGGGDDRAVERATRLKGWAEQAVAEGDYLLAIQRAYYAMQLVEDR